MFRKSGRPFLSWRLVHCDYEDMGLSIWCADSKRIRDKGSLVVGRLLGLQADCVVFVR